MSSRTTVIGITTRFVPMIAGRVVCWNCWEPWTSRGKFWAHKSLPPPEDINVTPELRTLWARTMGKPTPVTGYPDMFEAAATADLAGIWADQASFALMREFPVELFQVWFATKDGCPIAGPPPRFHDEPSLEEVKGMHPFQYDDHVLQSLTEEAGLNHAARWLKFFIIQFRQQNAANKKGLQASAIANDERIAALAAKIP